MIVWIILGIVTFLFLYLVFKCVTGRRFLKDVQKDSLIIFGKKGKGKTLLFSEMTRNEKHGYVSTTDFKHKGQILIPYNAVNIDPNTWEGVLNSEVTKIKKQPFEGKGVYLDDAGVFLPNFADQMLKKNYPSLPIAYAVWRHLYNAPIHINSQAVERTYKMLREQADGFIQVRGVRWFFGLGFIRCTYYDRIESAKAQLSPMRKAIFNKFSTTEYDKFVAMNGIIKDFLIFAPSWRNKYNSRYFHSVFFGFEPKKKSYSFPKSKKRLTKPTT